MDRRKGIESGSTRKWLLLVLLAGTAAVLCTCFRYVISEQKREQEARHCISVCNKNRLNRKIDSGSGSGESPMRIRSRRGFKSYEEYIELQLNKTLNPRLRKLWTSRDWRRKVDVFSAMFRDLMEEKEKGGLLRAGSKALCIGARVGQEVVALKEIGVTDAIGMDLVPYPPLVVHGDIHSHPFADNTFDFEFSNVFDHALYPSLFVSEIERTLKPGGVAVLHVAVNKRGDKYSANDLYSADPLIALFRNSTLVHIRRVDGFGLDTEIALRKNLVSIISI